MKKAILQFREFFDYKMVVKLPFNDFNSMEAQEIKRKLNQEYPSWPKIFVTGYEKLDIIFP